MGAYATDCDSEQFCEKTQTTTASKQSYCPFVLFRQYRRDRQENRDQARSPEIEKIREQVNQSQKKLKQMQKNRWARTTSTEQRRKIFEHGVESGGFYNYGCTYKKGWKYKLTWTGDGKQRSTIHNLSTAKGCDEAFEWWDKDHAIQSSAMAYYISKCDSWQARYKKYVKKHDSHLQDSLLKGDPTRWVRLTVEIIID